MAVRGYTPNTTTFGNKKQEIFLLPRQWTQYLKRTVRAYLIDCSKTIIIPHGFALVILNWKTIELYVLEIKSAYSIFLS